mgnify:FL=1
MRIPTPEECRTAPSESFKYAHLVEPYLEGCGIDVGSQGWPVVPWAISYDLPKDQFVDYCGGAASKGVIHLRGLAERLPFLDQTLDFVYSSHLIEDYEYHDWPRLVSGWARCLKHGGYVVVICPERERWHNYVAGGGIPNHHHRHEGMLGDFASVALKRRLKLIVESLTNVYPGDYSMFAVMQKP